MAKCTGVYQNGENDNYILAKYWLVFGNGSDTTCSYKLMIVNPTNALFRSFYLYQLYK